MNSTTVLLSAAGNVFMPGTVACLRNNGEREIRLVGADMSDDPTMLEMFDTYYAVPRGDSSDYPDVLLEICKKEHVDVLLPIMSSELMGLSSYKERFEAIGTKVSVSCSEALKIANNKLLLFKFLNSIGIQCAKYEAVSSIEDLIAASKRLGYPEKKVCVKAPESSGSRGFRILNSEHTGLNSFLNEKPDSAMITLEDFLKYFTNADNFPNLMVMEYLPGIEYTVDLLADNGKVLYNCCRKSLNMNNSIMLDGVTVENREATELCRQITEHLKLDGNIGFDLKEDSSGTPYVLECNPRITAGIPFFAAAGVNLPYLCVKKLLGERLPDVSAKIGMKMKRRYLEMYF